MSIIKTAFAALALSCSVATLSAPLAAAQGTEVGVINYSKVESDSKAGQSIKSQLGVIETQLQSEIAPQVAAVTAATNIVRPKIEGLDPQQIRQKRQTDAVFKTEHDDYLQKAQALEQATQSVQLVLQATRTEALKDFDAVAKVAMEQVAVENGVDLIIGRQNAMFLQPGVDLTDKMIAKLDATNPTIPVTRATNIELVVGRDGRIIGAQAADETQQQ